MTRAIVALATFSLLFAAFGATHAGAQEDPYGPTSSTAPPSSVDPTCTTTVSGTVGSEQTATVQNVPFGATVRVLIDGREAGRATAPSAFQESTTTLNVPFTVPDLEPGAYSLVAVGVDFTLSCTSDGMFDVLAASAGSGDDGDDLAFTGFDVLLLLVIAMALILIGRMLVRRTRSRRASVV